MNDTKKENVKKMALREIEKADKELNECFAQGIRNMGVVTQNGQFVGSSTLLADLEKAKRDMLAAIGRVSVSVEKIPNGDLPEDANVKQVFLHIRKNLDKNDTNAMEVVEAILENQ
jgi:hypothetical protein